jgi:hypothetical protein
MSDEKRKKLYKRLAIAAAVLIVLGIICYEVAYHACLRVMDSKIDEKNGEAKNCVRVISVYLEDSGITVPADKEIIVRGTIDGSGMYNEPCELIGEAVRFPYSLEKDITKYWVIKFSGGEPVAAWCAGWKLSDSELHHYYYMDQRSQYEEDVWKRGENVIGYYNKNGGT